MVVRIISPRLIHVWVPAGFFVIRACTSAARVVAATTCAMGTQNWIWLASESGSARRLHLTETAPGSSCVDLDSEFFSPTFDDGTSRQMNGYVSLDVGDLLSMRAFGERELHEGNSSHCGCKVEVFGCRRYMCFNAETGLTLESDCWLNEAVAVTMVCSVEHGPLRQAIVPRGFASPALVVANLSGLVRASFGMNYSSIRARSKVEGSDGEVLDLFQRPVFQALDPGHTLLVIVGCFRGGAVLYADEEENLATIRFVLKGGTKPLTQCSLRLSIERDSFLVIEEVTTGHRACFHWDKSTSSVVIDLDWDKRLSQQQNVQTEDYSRTLRNLLHGIEELGETERGYEAEYKRAEGLLESFNSALLFLSVCREKDQDEGVELPTVGSCSVRVSATSPDNSILLQRFDSMLGRDAFIIVCFENQTDVSLGDGWSLRLLLQNSSEKTASRITASFPIQGIKDNGIDSTELWRTMICPLQRIPPREKIEISFPIIIDSHVPMSVSVSLCFHRPVSSPPKFYPIDVSVELGEDLTLDILDFSKHASAMDINDSSHKLLALSQLMYMFSTSAVDNQPRYPVISRFDLPVLAEDAMKALGLEEPSKCFESLLGAQFMITVEAALHSSTENRGVPFQASTITIRGVTHIVPFVRAAVLRRILAVADKQSDTLEKAVVRDLADTERWKKSLQDSLDNSLLSFRRAEEWLVEAYHMFGEIDEGKRIEYCFDGQERKAVAAIVQNIRTSYGVWRRQSERLLTPSHLNNT